MRSRSKWALLTMLIFVVGLTHAQPANDQPRVVAQISSTPIRVQIQTSTPLPLDLSTPTSTFTPTPEVQAAAQLQAKESAGEINVRAEADIEAQPVGKIRFGDLYIVLGKYYRWYQIQYEDAPTGVAWVFEELVEVVGDPALIPDLTIIVQPTSATTQGDLTADAAQILLTPGAGLTLTAGSRELQGPIAAGGAEVVVVTDAMGELRTPMPTFTYPPDIPAASLNVEQEIASTTIERSSATEDSSLPPIVPIILLGGFGLLGLTISLLRR